MDLLTWGLYLVGSLFAGFISAYITHWLKLRRSRQDKWWDMKVAAYKDINSSLSNMKHSLNSWMDELLHLRSLDDDHKGKLNDSYSKAVDHIRLTVAAGNFLITEEAEQVMKELLNGMGDIFDPSLYIQFENTYMLVDEHQKKFNLIAKADLCIE